MVGSDLDRVVVGSAVPHVGPLFLANAGVSLGVLHRAAGTGSHQHRRRWCAPCEWDGVPSRNSGDGLYRARESGNRLLQRRCERSGSVLLRQLPGSCHLPDTADFPARGAVGAAGTRSAANERTIHKCIQPPFVQTCQLIMGFTELAEGSVWNTMPAHIHPRRSEVYLYFAVPQDAIVLHCLGKPEGIPTHRGQRSPGGPVAKLVGSFRSRNSQLLVRLGDGR